MRNLKYSLIILLSIIFHNSFAQIAWIDPPEPDVREEVTIYVDVSQDPICEKLVNSEGPLYFYTWDSDGALEENGSWDNSNEEMVMTHEGGTIWSFTFVPTELYIVDSFKDIYQNGLGFLLKEKDGGSGGDCSTEGGEFKTSDIQLNIPSPFVEPVYTIPDLVGDTTLFSRADDVFTLVYNNKLEENPAMIGATNLYVQVRAFDANGVLDDVIPPLSQLDTDPRLKMQDNGNTVYSFSLIPNDFFADVLPDGSSIESIQFEIIEFPYCGNSDCTVDGEFSYKFTCD